MDSPHALFTRDLGFYLVVVWAGAVMIGCVLAGIEPIWREWRAARRHHHRDGRAPGPARRLHST